jgi:hypothetical protein
MHGILENNRKNQVKTDDKREDRDSKQNNVRPFFSFCHIMLHKPRGHFRAWSALLKAIVGAHLATSVFFIKINV